MLFVVGVDASGAPIHGGAGETACTTRDALFEAQVPMERALDEIFAIARKPRGITSLGCLRCACGSGVVSILVYIAYFVRAARRVLEQTIVTAEDRIPLTSRLCNTFTAMLLVTNAAAKHQPTRAKTLSTLGAKRSAIGALALLELIGCTAHEVVAIAARQASGFGLAVLYGALIERSVQAAPHFFAA